MFVSKDLVFLELQKTGGSHILRLLSQWVEGESIGKHNRLDSAYEGRFVLGSVRNPWDWYVSLWAYGVGGKGALRHRTETGVDFSYYHRMLPKDMGKNWLSPSEFTTSIYHDLFKPTNAWRASYQDSHDPLQFRTWLKMLLDPAHRYDIGEGFAFTPLARHAGLMTYRYLRLFTLGDRVFYDPRLALSESVKDFDAEHNVAKAMIRMEALEDDFILALKLAGFTVSEEQNAEIKSSGKTNTSQRKTANYYYNAETCELVAKRERFIIQKYGYTAPSLLVSS